MKDGFIKNISGNTKVETFRENLNLQISYEIKRNNQTVEENQNVATGDILVTDTGDTYTLIVAGDINKDDIVNIKDIVRMRIYLLDRNNLDEIELMAADANADDKSISVKDLVRMRIIVLDRVGQLDIDTMT